MNIPNNMAFLIGSGISLGAGLPNTVQITEKILSGEGIMRHTNGNYYLGRPLNGIPDEYVPRIKEYLALLKEYIESYYMDVKSFKATYEDVFYIAVQILDDISGEYDNPAVRPLVNELIPKVKRFLDRRPRDLHSDWNMFYLAHEAVNYIHCVVWRLLNTRPKSIKYLENLALFLKSRTHTTVFTLNHDRVLEHLFQEFDIPYSDGFGPEVNEVKYWDGRFNNQNNSNIILLKLHGSVNWFNFRYYLNNRSISRVGKLMANDPWHAKNESLTMQLPSPSYPLMLIGTFNKMYSYTANVFGDLFFHFRNSLDIIDTLIICGYGFRDKGINTSIMEWIYSRDNRKIIVIDPLDENVIIERARPAVWRSWQDLRNDTRLVFIQKNVETISYDEWCTVMSLNA